MRHRGLTLIELLVILAITGILVTLLVASCSAPPPEETQTFVGKVETRTTGEDDDGNILPYIDVRADNNPVTERFTVEDGLTVEVNKRYAFRVWGSEPPRHIGEAIPIP